MGGGQGVELPTQSGPCVQSNGQVMNPYAAPATRPSSPTTRPAPQVVGRRCGTCDKRLATQAEGLACPSCSVAYHHRCLARPGHCAKCGEDIDALERVAWEEESRAVESGMRRGRTLVWSTAVSWALCQPVALSGGGAQLVALVVSSAFTVLLFWRAMNGSLGARRYLAGANMITMILAIFATTSAASLLSEAVFGMLALSQAFAFWVFAFSADARSYMDSSAPRMPRT